MQIISILHFASIYAVIRGAAAEVPSCFFPDGTYSTNDFACDLTGQTSFCCPIDSACLENKLCKGSFDSKNGTSLWRRGACTDLNFSDPACPQWCQEVAPNLDSWVVRCDSKEEDSTACCYDNGMVDPLGCCKNSSVEVFTIPGKAEAFNKIQGGASTMTWSSMPSGTVAAAPTMTTNMTTSASGTETANPSTASAGLTTGGKVGIAFGATALCVSALLLSLRFYRHRKARCQILQNSSSLAQEAGKGRDYDTPSEDPIKELNAVESAVLEMHSEREAVELMGQRPMELEGHGWH